MSVFIRCFVSFRDVESPRLRMLSTNIWYETTNIQQDADAFCCFVLCRQTCCVEVASYSCVLVSKAAESLVSLNYRYKHNYFLKKKGTNLLQCSPLTGNLYVLCVFLRQCFCGSKLYSVNTYYCLL